MSKWKMVRERFAFHNPSYIVLCPKFTRTLEPLANGHREYYFY